MSDAAELSPGRTLWEASSPLQDESPRGKGIEGLVRGS